MTAESAVRIRWRSLLICAAATLAAYAKSLSFPFVNWLDPERIVGPAVAGSLTLGSAWRAFIDLTRVPYQPFAHLVDALNVALAGTDPLAFHAVNVALQILAAVLVYVFLLRWKIDHVPAAIGALFFALHPLRVEAVAWASGRPELLATLGVLVSVICIDRYRIDGGVRWYLASLASAIAAIASSVAAAPWPLAMLLLRHPADERPAPQRLVESAPFLLVGFAGLAIPAVRLLLDAIAHGPQSSLIVDIAGVPSFVLSFFLMQTAIPSGLSVVYAMPNLGPWWWLILPLVVLLVWLALRAMRDHAMLRAGSHWALLFLIPAGLGLVDAPGPVSDRSMMLPSIGLAMIVGAITQALLRHREGQFARPVKVGAVLLLAFFGTLANIQSESWRSSVDLWTAAVERSPTSALAHHSLGVALTQETGELVSAERSFTVAVHHDPSMSAAYAGRGAVRASLGRDDEGLLDLDEALRLEPTDAASRMVRASILRRLGRRDEALRDMHLALAFRPMEVAWMVERVELLMEMGRTGEAAAELEVLRQAGYDVSVERR